MYHKSMNDWVSHGAIAKSKSASGLLQRAVVFCEGKNKAFALGAGNASDTEFLLEQGFEVIELDSSPIIPKPTETIDDPRLTIIQSSFEDYPFPINKFDLVNAQWSLPFTAPQAFEEMFHRLTDALRPGGVFVGQFFGKNDAWNIPQKSMTFHDKTEIGSLLTDMEILELTEEERDVTNAGGITKHWHVFHVIARKK